MQGGRPPAGSRATRYENFATFAPVFPYRTAEKVAAGIGVTTRARCLARACDHVPPSGARAYEIGGFGLFLLGIGHLPVIGGAPCGELGDALVLVGAVVHLMCIRRTRTESTQTAHKPLWKGIHQSCNLDVTYV